MDVTSYLLGKNASGGGGGSTTKLVPLTLAFSNYTGDIIDATLIDTSRITTMKNMFAGCSNVKTLDLSGWDASNVTSVNNMFYSCGSLENLSYFAIPRATNISGMFIDCNKLTNESVDNILRMCISATSFTGTKKLTSTSLNISIYTPEMIQSLPHYQDFVNAGWSIN